MIKVVSKHYVKEDKVGEFIEHAKKLVEFTVKEEGCINYQLCQDIKNPSILTIIEEWKDEESLDAHMNTEHFKAIVPNLKKLDAKPGELNLYRKLI